MFPSPVRHVKELNYGTIGGTADTAMISGVSENGKKRPAETDDSSRMAKRVHTDERMIYDTLVPILKSQPETSTTMAYEPSLLRDWSPLEHKSPLRLRGGEGDPANGRPSKRVRFASQVEPADTELRNTANSNPTMPFVWGRPSESSVSSSTGGGILVNNTPEATTINTSATADTKTGFLGSFGNFLRSWLWRTKPATSGSSPRTGTAASSLCTKNPGQRIAETGSEASGKAGHNPAIPRPARSEAAGTLTTSSSTQVPGPLFLPGYAHSPLPFPCLQPDQQGPILRNPSPGLSLPLVFTPRASSPPNHSSQQIPPLGSPQPPLSPSSPPPPASPTNPASQQFPHLGNPQPPLAPSFPPPPAQISQSAQPAPAPAGSPPHIGNMREEYKRRSGLKRNALKQECRDRGIWEAKLENYSVPQLRGTLAANDKILRAAQTAATGSKLSSSTKRPAATSEGRPAKNNKKKRTKTTSGSTAGTAPLPSMPPTATPSLPRANHLLSPVSTSLLRTSSFPLWTTPLPPWTAILPPATNVSPTTPGSLLPTTAPALRRPPAPGSKDGVHVTSGFCNCAYCRGEVSVPPTLASLGLFAALASAGPIAPATSPAVPTAPAGRITLLPAAISATTVQPAVGAIRAPRPARPAPAPVESVLTADQIAAQKEIDEMVKEQEEFERINGHIWR